MEKRKDNKVEDTKIEIKINERRKEREKEKREERKKGIQTERQKDE